MKKFAAIAAIMAVVLYALPAPAGTCGCAKCAKCPQGSFFQSSSDALRCFHPNPWLLQPMKPVGPVKKEQVDQFQKLADSIERCPAKGRASKCCCPRCTAHK